MKIKLTLLAFASILSGVADPASEIFRGGGGGGGLSSGIEVPTGEDFYALKDVPQKRPMCENVSR